jgi:uncharacterized short protein YbdD (DUF466 family)
MSWLAVVAESVRLMLGLPSYAAYRRHMAERHPEAEPMDEVAFFRDRQQARYGSGGGRCC